MTEKQPPSYPLRMPQELRERLAEVAKESGRSMNAEIVARLQESFYVRGSGSASMRITASGEGHIKSSGSSADEIADKVAERLMKMKLIPTPLEQLDAATPDYAKPRSKKNQAS